MFSAVMPTRHALRAILSALKQFPNADVLYGDEWLVDADRHTVDLIAKPAFDPLLAARGALFGNACLFHTRCFQNGEFPDLLKVASWPSSRVVHLPFPLVDTNTIRVPSSKQSDARRSDAPKISIVIPSRNGFDLVNKCLTTLFEKTDYQNYEVIVVDNGSDDQRVMELYERCEKLHDNFRVLKQPGKFNFAALVNAGASLVDGHICLLNNDIEISRTNWLSKMVDTLQSKVCRVGVVGAKLLYPSRDIQHIGVAVGMNETADHPHKGASELSGYIGQMCLAERSTTAVTAAAMLIRKDCWQELSGFDAERFAVTYNDVDFCLRSRRAGWVVAMNGEAELIHHESASRGGKVSDERALQNRLERQRFQDVWKTQAFNDPFLSPHHSIYSREARLKTPSQFPEARVP
ncbi:MAG: glycosyltransferase family 2 protein [Pseudomonadota bacterium]